jgi:hypothetical protein
MQWQEIANLRDLTAELEKDVAHEKKSREWDIEDVLADMG